ncbi:MAG: YihY/virulence factor BrkB family protein [Myxococcota bacterium]
MTESSSPRGLIALLKTTFSGFTEDNCMQMAAALSYYTAFSIAPLLMLVILLAGTVFGQEAIEGTLSSQLTDILGPTTAELLQTMLAQVRHKTSGGIGLATLAGLVGMFLGATGLFGQIQDALNRIWRVGPDPDQGGLAAMLTKRLFSFLAIALVSSLLLASLLLSTFVAALGAMADSTLPIAVPQGLWWGVDLLVSLGLTTALFTILFKVLPDARLHWKDAIIGALFTTLLFSLGKLALGRYLGGGSIGSAFGAAGALALILAWVYYTSMIVLLGAQFTRAWVRSQGRIVQPRAGAVKFVVSRTVLRDEPAEPSPSKSHPH